MKTHTGSSNKLKTSADTDDKKAAAFFEVVYRAFERAEYAAGVPVDRYYNIGEYVVRLRFAGSTLLPLIIPALEHLATDSVVEPALTICLWDSESTGTKMPPPAWSPRCYGARGEIKGFNNKRVHTVYQPGIDVLHMLDIERKLAIYWTHNVAQFPFWEKNLPLRTILNWWLCDQPLQIIHAGAVGTEQGGVLVVGKSGAGKSTTALSCLYSDLYFAGDDHVLMDLSRMPYVYSLYNTAKLEATNTHRFPGLDCVISNPHKLDTQKASVFLNDCYPEKLIRGFPIQAILLPKVTGSPDTHIRTAAPIDTLLALAPTTLSHLPGASHEAFQKMTDLAHRVPSYFLEAGTDISGIASVILDFLSRVKR